MSPTITAELFASLDLVVAEPQEWHFPWLSEGMLAEVAREQATGSLLLGRRTYESFAAAWPHRADTEPLAGQLNRMQKVVVSDELDEADCRWGPLRIVRHRGEITTAVESLPAAGRHSVAGSITLVERLIAAGLLTELRLIIHPIIIGAGRRLFDGWEGPPTPLDLIESATLEHGAQLNVYRPKNL